MHIHGASPACAVQTIVVALCFVFISNISHTQTDPLRPPNPPLGEPLGQHGHLHTLPATLPAPGVAHTGAARQQPGQPGPVRRHRQRRPQTHVVEPRVRAVCVCVTKQHAPRVSILFCPRLATALSRLMYYLNSCNL